MSRPNTTHTFPIKDLIEHDLEGDDCICGPAHELVSTDHGDEWFVVHESLDGREIEESITP